MFRAKVILYYALLTLLILAFILLTVYSGTTYQYKYEDNSQKCNGGEEYFDNVVADESEEQTIFNPITGASEVKICAQFPAARGMEYEYGKYYLDPEDGKTYLCKRLNETGTIVLYYLPHELVGNYFEET